MADPIDKESREITDPQFRQSSSAAQRAADASVALTAARVGWKALFAPKKVATFLLKLAAYLVAVLVFGTCLYVIHYQLDRRTLTEFLALQQVDPLKEAEKLVQAGELCDALEYLDYFREYDYVKNDPRVTEFYNKVLQERESYWFRMQDVASGVWKGKGACAESLVSATASDFFVVGDLRDLAWQGWNVYMGNDVDEFTASLAGVGVVLAVVTYGSGGAAGPFKGVVSVLKVSKKLKKIPKSLQKGLVKLFKEASRLRSLKPVRPAFLSIVRISKVNGLKAKDMLEILSRSRKVSDLKFMEQVAAAYGKQTGKALRLGKDMPVKVLKRFGKSRQLTKAVDQSLQFGSRGTRLLEKVGPTRFMRYLKMTKYGVRGVRSVWQARLTLMLAWFLKLLPQWAVFLVTGLTGLVVVGVPIRLAYKGLRSLGIGRR